MQVSKWHPNVGVERTYLHGRMQADNCGRLIGVMRRQALRSDIADASQLLDEDAAKLVRAHLFVDSDSVESRLMSSGEETVDGLV